MLEIGAENVTDPGKHHSGDIYIFRKVDKLAIQNCGLSELTFIFIRAELVGYPNCQIDGKNEPADPTNFKPD